MQMESETGTKLAKQFEIKAQSATVPHAVRNLARCRHCRSIEQWEMRHHMFQVGHQLKATANFTQEKNGTTK